MSSLRAIEEYRFGLPFADGISDTAACCPCRRSLGSAGSPWRTLLWGRMRVTRVRRLQALTLLLVLGAPLAGLLGWGAYLHSGIYRRSVERDLEAFFGLEARVGRVEVIDFHRRRFHDVTLSLPGGKEVFRCAWALYDRRSRTGDGRFDVLLHGAHFVIDEQDNAHFRRIGRQDFSAPGVGVLSLEQSTFDVRQHGLHVRFGNAYGEIRWVESPNLAQADVRAWQVGSFPADPPVHAAAIFSPVEGITLQTVHLTIPSLPLEAVAAERILGENVTTGSFQGRVDAVFEGAPQIDVRGRLVGVDLAQWTRGQLEAGIEGSVDVWIDQARFLGNGGARLQQLLGRATATRVDLAGLADPLNVPGLTGMATLHVTHMELQDGVLRRLEAVGDFAGLRLAPLVRAAGLTEEAEGQFTGRLARLAVQDGRLVEARLLVEQEPEAPAWISARLLRQLRGDEAGRTTAPAPSAAGMRLRYEDLMVELLLSDGQIRISGQREPGTQRTRPLVYLRLGPELGLALPPASIGGELSLDVREPLQRLEESLAQRLLRYTRTDTGETP